MMPADDGAEWLIGAIRKSSETAEVANSGEEEVRKRKEPDGRIIAAGREMKADGKETLTKRCGERGEVIDAEGLVRGWSDKRNSTKSHSAKSSPAD